MRTRCARSSSAYSSSSLDASIFDVSSRSLTWAEQHARVAQDHLEVAAPRVVGRQVGLHALGRGEDQGQRRAQLVAHVGEELRLEAVELLGARVEHLELLVGLLERPAGVGHLAGPADDLGLHGVDAARCVRARRRLARAG